MSIQLTPTWVIGSIDLTYEPYSVDRDSSVDVGEPEMIVSSAPSALADGDPTRVTRYGNRVYQIDIYIEGPTLLDVAEAEAALRTELKRKGLELAHNPGDGFSATSVYEVQTAQLTPQRIDEHESHLIRKFTLTLTCLPFARSLEPVTVAALPVGSGAEVVLDTCDSATGWTTEINGSPSGAADPAWLGQTGAVWVYEIFATGPQTLTLIRTGTFSVVNRPYVRVNIRANEPLLTTASAVVDGVTQELSLISQRKSPANSDEHEFVFSVAPGSSSVTSLRVSNYSYADYSSLGISEVAHRGAPSPYLRQGTRYVESGGTERTPASIHAQSANGADALTTAIVHTSPNDGSGYSPPLRRWRTVASTGPVTTDATTFSGGYEPIAFVSGGFYAEVPTSALPEGGYTLLVRVRLASSPPAAVTVFYSTSTIFPSGSTQEGFTNGSTTVTLSDTNWALVPVAVLSLPSVRTTAGRVQVVLQSSTTHAQVYLDEAWLFRVDDDCALSIIKTPRPHAWLDSPDASSPVPTVWVGDGASTRVHPGEGLMAQGAHVLSSDGTAVFVAALTDNPATDATFYRRWHSNAAD